MGEESVPKVDGEVFVGTAEPGNEMILECLDCPFSSIVAMKVQQDQLVVNAFLSEKLLEHPGSFIVKVL